MNLARPQWKMLQQRLPHLMTALIVIQPALDVLSFWLNAAGMGNALTLALRCALLVAVFLLGFALAEKRRRYLILAAVLVAFAACHAAAVLQADAMTLPSEGEATGLGALLSDLINYVRVAQIPVFTFCFITFLKRSGEAGLRSIKKGFLIALLLIAAVEVLSVLTGTDPHTYAAKDIGVLGWFYGTNAQSAILCILIPVSIMTVIQKSARMLPQIALCVLGFGMLYLFGTRLAYAAIFATAVGLAFTLFVADRAKRRSIVLLLGCAVLGFGISVEVAPDVLLVPGEGLVGALTAASGRRFGSVKVAFDVTLVLISLTLSLLFFHRLNGLGLGTVISALLVGRFVNLYNSRLPLIAHIARLAHKPDAAKTE